MFAEEFGIYLNYVRKLGFEETPDYDFLRELFTKVLRGNGDVDDSVFDWNLLNGICYLPSICMFMLMQWTDGKGWEASTVRYLVSLTFLV